MSNSSSITQFLLLEFTNRRELQLLHFWLFLGIYLAALLGNSLIITAIACDHHLHTPMYFFLLNLSLLDPGSISTIVPKSMTNPLWDTRAISYYGCAAQVFFFIFLVAGEYALLTVMAYDRYVAICNALDQFFCEIPQILKLSCSNSCLKEVGLLVVGVFVDLGTATFAYLKPPSISSQSLNLVVALLYSVVPPALNPLIYSMRNQDLKDAIWKVIECTFFSSSGSVQTLLQHLCNKMGSPQRTA
ncbi:olfactory receptor 5A1-like [Phoenicopterus ruber ruber]